MWILRVLLPTIYFTRAAAIPTRETVESCSIALGSFSTPDNRRFPCLLIVVCVLSRKNPQGNLSNPGTNEFQFPPLYSQRSPGLVLRRTIVSPFSLSLLAISRNLGRDWDPNDSWFLIPRRVDLFPILASLAITSFHFP